MAAVHSAMSVSIVGTDCALLMVLEQQYLPTLGGPETPPPLDNQANSQGGIEAGRLKT